MPHLDVMNKATGKTACAARAPASKSVPLPVVKAGPIRKSKNSRRRAISLIAVHLLIIGHIAHWLIAGETLSPVEPSEAMYALNEGHINAGVIFFALAILATLIFGRFFCGWGCHLLAYQDLCGWLMRKAGIKPKPFRSRILLLAPLALAIYMFVWPTVYRWWFAIPGPELSNHLMTSRFWATFPGVTIALLTFAVCGFAIVYFLGSKGFCTYACPYGGFFAMADQGATGRILVTDACEGCGHCTATCTSNVRVHEEVAAYGMVVDPGCMKCMDCVSVCPNDALHFGFAKPPIGAKPKRKTRPRHYDFSWGEELLMLAVGLGALVTYRGLYGQVPLLFSMGLAAITGYLSIKTLRLLRESNVRLQNLSLKRGGRLSRAGAIFAACMAAWLMFTGHSAAVQAQSWHGQRLLASLGFGDQVWSPGRDWSAAASAEERNVLATAVRRLENADRWGLVDTPVVLHKLVWAYLAGNDLDAAERCVRRLVELLPHKAEPHRGLAGVLRKRGRNDEGVAEYRAALEIEPDHTKARAELCGLLTEMGRSDEAIAEYWEGLKVSPDDTRLLSGLIDALIAEAQFDEAERVLADASAASDTRPTELAGMHVRLGAALANAGQNDRGVTHFHRAVELDPASADAHYNLAMALLLQRRVDDAVEHFQRTVALRPEMAVAHYNLGVAVFMSGRPAEAEPHVRQALRLDPEDPDARGFLAVIREHLDPAGGPPPGGRD